ncbi:signal peptidase I [Adlercreutzia sp. R21]|uniref:signal peptidase I n=1 Tax=Adlercreutzia wanghongyangiae TaxID=3111451 RepID=UPI002DBF2973|nr:signal peptidase I [Adlercreutzia sp. R21]MEC4184512.1 signal peptidase I [Adlercreutzia sp. R21]
MAAVRPSWYIDSMAQQSANISHDSFSHAVERRLTHLRVAARLCAVVGACIIVALLVVGMGAAVVPRVLGMQSYAIISGSMEPAYPTGSLVYAEPASGESLQPGDVAAFWRDEDVIVHRVQENDAAAGELITKGDANAENDLHPVPYQNVLGLVTFSVPYVGYFLMALGSTSGMLVLGWIILMGVAFRVVGSVLGNLADRRERADGTR